MCTIAIIFNILVNFNLLKDGIQKEAEISPHLNRITAWYGHIIINITIDLRIELSLIDEKTMR